MTGQWIGNGEGEPSVPLEPSAEPYREREPRQHRGAVSRWWSRTPVGAFLSVMRMVRKGMP